MSICEWLLAKGYDPDKGLCVTVGTDGLKAERNNIMSISTAGVRLAPETVYIDGADCEATYKYTGVDCSYYDEHKVGIDRAVELLSKRVNDSQFIVGYAVKGWLRPWLQFHAPELFTKVEFLDIIDIIRIAESGEPLPTNVETVTALAGRLNSSLVASRAPSFELLCNRYLPEDSDYGDVILEEKIGLLKDLYNHTLLRR